MALPWQHSSPATMVSSEDESIINGTRAMSTSPAAIFKNVRIAAGPSISPSSIHTSIICAPAATCVRATAMAPA